MLVVIVVFVFYGTSVVSKKMTFHPKRMILIKANPPANLKTETHPRKKEKTEASATSKDKIEVKLQAVKPVWVDITAGSKDLYSGTLQPGIKLRFIGREIKVKADNGGAVKMIIGGNPVGALGEEGVAAEKTYKAAE